MCQSRFIGCDAEKNPHTVSLEVSAEGFANLSPLAALNPFFARMWNKLMDKGWCGKKISSPIQVASISDLLLFLCWAKHNQTIGNIWVDVAQFVYPKMVYVAGILLEKYALHLARRDPEPLPLLKSQKGNSMVNKMVLLKRLAAQRRHRTEVMQTHSDLTSKQDGLVLHEKVIESCLYLQNLVTAFEECQQLAISWDASWYDCETLVLLAYDCTTKATGYLPIQNLAPVLSQELGPETRELAFAGKATRIENFNTLRAISHSLSVLGLPLESFETQSDLHLGPFLPEEARLINDGVFYIQNDKTGSLVRQVPANFDWHKVPVLLGW